MNAAQRGLCAVCGHPQTYRRNGKLLPLAVDHDHETGMVRGLLCHDCNRAIGGLRESADIAFAASQYLRKFSRPALGVAV